MAGKSGAVMKSFNLKRKMITAALILILCSANAQPAKADLPVIDFVNAALSEFRNSLMENHFAQEIVVFFDQLTELENTYQEIMRFNAGIEEFIRHFVEDAAHAFRNSQSSFRDTFLAGLEPSAEQDAIRNLGVILEGYGDPSGIKSYIETIHGADPQSVERAFITFDEAQVGEAYLMAHEIRKRSDETKQAGENIQDLSQTASPKGAARLAADASGKLIVVTQQNQEIFAKLLEVEAAKLEQVSRDEKRFERERLKYMREMQLGSENLGRPA